jgi:hypothetical protein
MTIAVSGSNITFNDNSVQNTAATGFGFKNRIINGAMVIDQRNSGASVTPATDDTYTVDRWAAAINVASKFSVQQNTADAPTTQGFTNCVKITSLSAYSVGSGDVAAYKQVIEGFNIADLGWGTASAKAVTLSFWVRSSLTGTFGGTLMNGVQNRAYPFTYTINTANTFEYKTITIAGDTTGTWAIGNTAGIRLYFQLGVGSTFVGTAGSWSANNYFGATGATNIIATNAATWFVTGVQLEKGSTATSFDYRPYGTELALCQRYLPCFNFSASNGSLGAGFATASSQAIINCVFPVQARTQATGVVATGSFNAYTVAGGNSGNFTSIALAAGQSAFSGAIICSGGSGLTTAQGTFLLSPAGNSQIQFTGCEL